MGPREELNVAFLALKLSQRFLAGSDTPECVVVVEVETGYGAGRRQGHGIDAIKASWDIGNIVIRIVGPAQKTPAGLWTGVDANKCGER